MRDARRRAPGDESDAGHYRGGSVTGPTTSSPVGGRSASRTSSAGSFPAYTRWTESSAFSYHRLFAGSILLASSPILSTQEPNDAPVKFFRPRQACG
jgi:hypothetical protein